MHTTQINYLSAKDIKYTINGVNIFGLRKARLRVLLAKPLGVDHPNEPKNTMLGDVVRALDALNSPLEIMDLALINKEIAPDPADAAPAATPDIAEV